MECVYRLGLGNKERQEGEEEGTEERKRKLASRILLGLHYIFAEEEREGKNATVVDLCLMGAST